MTNVPTAFFQWIDTRAKRLGVEVSRVDDIAHPPVERFDDIVLLGANPELIEAVSPRLGRFGILAILDENPLSRLVQVDVGRVHYDRWLFVGSTAADIAAAYRDVPVRSKLKPGGRVWFVGAGGPMGRMHVQRAIQLADGPGVIVCTDVSDLRLDDLCTSSRRKPPAKASSSSASILHAPTNIRRA